MIVSNKKPDACIIGQNAQQLIDNNKITKSRFKELSGDNQTDLNDSGVTRLILADRLNANTFVGLSGEDRADIKINADFIAQKNININEFLKYRGPDRTDFLNNQKV